MGTAHIDDDTRSAARERVVRGMLASIEGAAERVRVVNSTTGRPEYGTQARERDLAYAEETLAALTAYAPLALASAAGADVLRVLGEARASMAVAS